MVRGREEPVGQVFPDGGVRPAGMRLLADYAVVPGQLAASAGPVLYPERMNRLDVLLGRMAHLVHKDAAEIGAVNARHVGQAGDGAYSESRTGNADF